VFSGWKPPRPGTVTVLVLPETPGWVRIQWGAGNGNVYRMGAEGKYDLQLLGC
jgi:hypothetical protein